jgi:uncharacterized repeat protein (TIGR03803 family)
MRYSRQLSIVRSATLAVALTGALLTGAGTAQAWTLKTLYSFKGGSDGSYPLGRLVRDAATGDFYGATINGGDVSCDPAYGNGCGTVFKVAPDGTETILHTFRGEEGGHPYAGPIQDKAGNLYGTATYGGTDCDRSGRGCGVIYSLAPDGTYTILHAFAGGAKDGEFPQMRLTRDGATGDLYGTTSYGGAGNKGVVFKLAADGKFTLLHSFTGGADGASPYTGVTLDSSGNLFGTASEGGDPECGCGIVFKLTPDSTYTVLYAFSHRNQGYPSGELITDDVGNLYGPSGGFYGLHGDIFEITTQGQHKLLHKFKSRDYEQGLGPHGKLLRDKSGTIYGVESGGDPYTGGVFQLQSDGAYQLIYSFSKTGGEGWYPAGGLIADNRGNLYGLTSQGGAYGQGTLYELKSKHHRSYCAAANCAFS